MSAAAWLPAVKPQKPHSLTSKFRHLGAFGLFVLAILDSSPVPTLGGPDILTTILSASHRNPWYEYTAVAAAGSVIGAYMTFRLARKAGEAYLQKHFTRKARGMLDFFNRWGNERSGRVNCGAISVPHERIFCGRRREQVRDQKIRGCRAGLQVCPLRCHWHCCGLLRPALHPGTAPSRRILGFPVASCLMRVWPERVRDSAESA